MCKSLTQYMNGAKALITLLEQENITHIFGYPGGANLPIYDQLLHSSIHPILVRHEQGAAHMADGFARVTNKTAICLATSGPGATNLVTGLATAMLDSIPLVVITAQTPRQFIGQDFFQEVDTVNIMLSVSKHSELVSNEKNLIPIIKNAFHIANTGRKGPVLIDIPTDILANRFDYNFNNTINLPGYKPIIQGDKGQIRRAVRLLKKAKSPVFVLGGGISLSQAEKEILDLIHQLQIPAVRTLKATGIFEETDPLYLGIIGTHGHKQANEAIQKEADTIIAIGARFSNRTIINTNLFAPQAKLIHIDIDPAEIGKVIPADVPIVGDIKNILHLFKQEIEKSAWTNETPWITSKQDKNFIAPTQDSAEVMQWIFETLSSFDIPLHITTDVGRHQIWANHFCNNLKHLPIISSYGLGTMGFGMPAAIGAWFADQDKKVISISGDGSFMMNMQELVVAVENHVPLVVILINDGGLGMIRELQRAVYGGRFTAQSFKHTIDFPMYAESVGAIGLKIETKDQIKPALEKALNSQNVVLLDFQIHKIFNNETNGE